MNTACTRRSFILRSVLTAASLAGAETLASRSWSARAERPSRGLVPVTLDLREATSVEALKMLFEAGRYNYIVHEEVTGFVSVAVQDVTFSRALVSLLRSTNPHLTYIMTSGAYEIVPYPNFGTPLPPLPKPSDLRPLPTHPTLESKPRRLSGVLYWADGPFWAILETGGPFTGDRRLIQAGDSVPSGVAGEPEFRVQSISPVGAVLSTRKGKAFSVPLMDLTAFRVSTPAATSKMP